ncbi:GNAT family N-acetyltransferase [Kineococcus sp. T13]|uniref:GNAT family N-acetyltransferase n=1 Tax=Kineococcus vitellinus TaxID=2696565 RepID=UPI001411FB14|nr:GNAT family N-acetyltransferase [Kineococcus vitellinus]NAZ74324.1 GNAT family N-acetyltransferase [Kineococcus vitellinus]
MARSYPSELTSEPSQGLRLRLSSPADAESITAWLAQEEVHRWWGGAPVALEQVVAKYTGVRLPGVVVYIIETAEAPVGLIQAWQEGARCGLDMFLAAGAQGRGLGPVVARALAEELTARRWRPLTVDPAVANVRAVRAWRRAGFVPTGERGLDEGREREVMAFVPVAAH